MKGEDRRSRRLNPGKNIGAKELKSKESRVSVFCGIPAPFFIIERFKRSGRGADPDFERKIQTASSSRWRLA